MASLRRPPRASAEKSSPATDHLQREIARLRTQLETARRELASTRQAAHDAKERFLSAVSHELRTPLSAIVLWTSLIEDQKVVDPEQLREAVDAIKRSAEEQRELIENLVDAARLVSGKLQLEAREFSVDAVVHEALAGVADGARASGIELAELPVGLGPIFCGDARRLRQAIGYVLQHALKSVPAGARISAGVKRVDDTLQIVISDNKSTVDPELLARVFATPVLGEQAAMRLERGLGLGLAIARQIVELQGGSIVARSEGAGRGTAFAIRLPAAPSPLLAPNLPADSREQIAGLLRGRHVLLVEDVPSTRAKLSSLLREAGADVDAVASAPAAWETFERQQPDVIVSDLSLPGPDGHALLRRIRAIETDRHTPSTPAIAITAFAGDNVRGQALASGFQTLLTKPLEPLLFVSTLASAYPSSPA